MMASMTHGMFDCIGLSLDDERTVESFVAEHREELTGVTLDDGWFAGRWTDPSGAIVWVELGPDGAVGATPGFAGDHGVRVVAPLWVERTDRIVFDVPDDGGETATRFCADVEQWWRWTGLPEETSALASVAGLVQQVAVFADTDAFRASPEADIGELDEPRTLPDGTVQTRMTLAAGSFIPLGMFGEQANAMAQISGIVESAELRTNQATGEPYVTATVRAVGVFPIALCWPVALAPVPEVGNVVHAQAYLTARVERTNDLTDAA